jgi:hypothetical protein
VLVFACLPYHTFTERFWRTFPDQAQGIQPNTGFLQGGPQLLLLFLRKSDFLRANVIIHQRERLQAFHLAAQQMGSFL